MPEVVLITGTRKGIGRHLVDHFLQQGHAVAGCSRAAFDGALPAGLVVNELLTNALKHAFAGRDGGTITLHRVIEPSGCKLVLADECVGLP